MSLLVLLTITGPLGCEPDAGRRQPEGGSAQEEPRGAPKQGEETTPAAASAPLPGVAVGSAATGDTLTLTGVVRRQSDIAGHPRTPVERGWVVAVRAEDVAALRQMAGDGPDPSVERLPRRIARGPATDGIVHLAAIGADGAYSMDLVEGSYLVGVANPGRPSSEASTLELAGWVKLLRPLQRPHADGPVTVNLLFDGEAARVFVE